MKRRSVTIMEIIREALEQFVATVEEEQQEMSSGAKPAPPGA